MMMLPKMLTHYLLNVRSEFVVVTLDIKDAFLMAAQPTAENAYVQIDDRIYKLLRCLPGQRTAAMVRSVCTCVQGLWNGAGSDAAYFDADAQPPIPHGAR